MEHRQRHSQRALLALLLLFMGYLLTINLSIDQQLFSAWSLVLLLWWIRNNSWVHSLSGRLVFLGIVSYVSLRYLIWRTFDTLVYINFVEFLFMALLFLAELEVAMVYLLGLFSNIWPSRFNSKMPLPDNPNLVPTVDVFVPTYNEPEEVVEITLLACKALQYPAGKLRIHLLDDGATSNKRNHPEHGSQAWHRYHTLQQFCQQHGINYLTRDQNDHAKAGNINHALQHTNGDLILFLDCDHVPTADFLQYTVGYFLQNPKLFLVQTPHFFINPDPIEKSLNTFHNAPSENEMFFRATHPGINLWNSSFFCGSAAIMRRSCLLEVGGFRGESITEDAETSLDLHARGYDSLFVERPMVCGLSPEIFGRLYRTAQSLVSGHVADWFSTKSAIYERIISGTTGVLHQLLSVLVFWFRTSAVFYRADIVYFI